jgi:flavorubredoxin
MNCMPTSPLRHAGAPASAGEPLRFAQDVTRLGGTIALDGTASWAPPLPGRFQPVNSYVVQLPTESLRIDTGLAVHRDLFLRQMQSVVPRDRRFAVFLTRAEPECAGNVSIMQPFRPISELIASAFRPFDSYEDGLPPTIKVTSLAMRFSKTVTLGERPSLIVIATKMRLLSCVWVYDQTSRTLFSSDFFGHTSIPSPAAPVVIDSIVDDATTYESAQAHILAKFWWIGRAKTQPLIDDIEDTFKTFDIENIAPTHGCILRGRDVVRKHLDLAIRVLRETPLQPTAGATP